MLLQCYPFTRTPPFANQPQRLYAQYTPSWRSDKDRDERVGTHPLTSKLVKAHIYCNVSVSLISAHTEACPLLVVTSQAAAKFRNAL